MLIKGICIYRYWRVSKDCIEWLPYCGFYYPPEEIEARTIEAHKWAAEDPDCRRITFRRIDYQDTCKGWRAK